MNSIYFSRLISNATNTGNAKKSGTFRAWQEKAIKTRQALKTVREDYEKESAEIFETYRGQAYLDRKTELDRKYQAVVGEARKTLETALEAVIESKRRQFDRCSGAPSEEDLRLLQALAMRTSLSIAEVATVAGKLNGNSQGLAVLRDIAAKSGITIPVGLSTPEKFDTAIEQAREYCLDRLSELDRPDGEAGYKALSFFGYPGQGEAEFFFRPLDDNLLTTEQISTATRQAKQTAERAAEPEADPGAIETVEGDAVAMWAEVTTTGNMSLGTIARQFHVSPQQIREANPGKDLEKLNAGDRVFVPSTRFSYQPDPSGAHVQPGQVRAVPARRYDYKTGPNGEEIGSDIEI